MSKFQFYSQNRSMYGTINVWWEYNQSGRSITITDVTYNNDMWWCAGAAMRLTVNWNDGTNEDLASGDWNWNGSGLVSSARGAGFINVGESLGIFDNESHPTHTFGGNSGGFGISFGATKTKLNNLDVEYYKALPMIAGDNPSVTFIIPPSINCNAVRASVPSVWRLQSSISGVNYGVGWSGVTTLRAEVSYSFNGKAYSYTAGTWTDGRTSATLDINAYDLPEPWTKVPAGANVTVRWTASTNIGSATCSATTFARAPATPTFGNMTVSNPKPFQLQSSVSGVNYGDYYRSRSLYATVKGNIDGETISWQTPAVKDALEGEFDRDAWLNDQPTPWRFVPDGEEVTVTWNAEIDVGYGKITGTISRTLMCQPAYEAFVLDSAVQDGAPVAADLLVSSSTGAAPRSSIRRVLTIEE